MSDVKLKIVGRLKGCPMCGMRPAHGPAKVKHCQLHGEPYQDYRIWCRSRCSFIERGDLESAIQAWNDRLSDTANENLIAELVGALENLIAAGDKAGICDDILAVLYPDIKNRNGTSLDDVAKQSRRAMNEARATLTKAREHMK